MGHVEVVDIRRRSRKQSELLRFKGVPGSKHSVARSVLVTIVDQGIALPSPWIDAEHEEIHMYYPTMDHPELQALLADPSGFVCYFWTSGDGLKSHAWLLQSR